MLRNALIPLFFGLAACGSEPSGATDIGDDAGTGADVTGGDTATDDTTDDAGASDVLPDPDAASDAGAADAARDAESDGDTDEVPDVANDADVSVDADPDVAPSCPGEPTTEDDRQIATGIVRGTVSGNSVAFLGIPFAQPPTGNLRWRSPEPAECLGDVLVANEWTPACAQINEDGDYVGDEDCLRLNVWQPLPVTDELSPVLVFIHGGGNVQGSAGNIVPVNVRLYDSADFASETGAVVVTIQYRLGVFGWLTRPRETWSDGKGGEGNLGLLDQIAALQWVQDNIRSFGGDPSRVVIFGESAGARNVCVLAVSPAAEGLFTGAIVQSGACILPPERVIFEETQSFLDTFEECSGDLDCLRDLSAEEIVRGYPLVVSLLSTSSATQPWVDGTLVPAQPEDALRAGQGVTDFMIVGANDDETSRFVPDTLTETQLRNTLVASYGPTIADDILAQYPVASFGSPAEAYVQMTSDARFVCNARRAAAAAHEGGIPVWHYHFEQQTSGRTSVFGSWHGLDLLYLFDALNVGGYRATAAEVALGELMRQHWSSLAAEGTPADGAEWPAWTPTGRDSMLYIAGESAAVTDVHADQCDFWDEYYDLLTP